MNFVVHSMYFNVGSQVDDVYKSNMFKIEPKIGFNVEFHT
jgi:hypothetical protein